MWFYAYEYSAEKDGVMHHGEGVTTKRHRSDLAAFRSMLRAIDLPETIHSCPLRYVLYRIVGDEKRLVMCSMA